MEGLRESEQTSSTLLTAGPRSAWSCMWCTNNNRSKDKICFTCKSIRPNDVERRLRMPPRSPKSDKTPLHFNTMHLVFRFLDVSERLSLRTVCKAWNAMNPITIRLLVYFAMFWDSFTLFIFASFLEFRASMKPWTSWSTLLKREASKVYYFSLWHSGIR